MSITKTLAVGTFLASTLLAGSAFAKGHDQGQGNNDKAGNQGFTSPEQTTRAAHNLGAVRGNRPMHAGPPEYPGKSEEARGSSSTSN